MMLYGFVRPLLFSLEAETAHRFTLNALDAVYSAGLSRLAAPCVPPYPVQVMGLSFPNPVGLAAGLDKNGEHIDSLSALGFGFIEVGTVTPRPQPGNPRPRIFRIPPAQALINRMGFNNLGAGRLVANVKASRYKGILGINIGKNFDTPMERAAQDYVIAMRKVYGVASYITVNISSPNTQNLRQLQQSEALAQLLATLKTEQANLQRQQGRYVPLVIKIAPDLTHEEIRTIAALVLEHGIDGIIATNTTVSRRGVEGLVHSEQAGGLSGAPLRTSSTEVIRNLHGIFGERVPIIGVGGILDGESAQEKIQAGAALVQIYTGLIYRGPELIGESVRAICLAACAILRATHNGPVQPH
ncbi:MAG: quinone-dependent dihydroorotate dehydrogenase [Betaproteobacteria bacterium]|nr:quinone-dependent dihydroorotate dehydrogenase [Betaproteobacteria bacterium]